MSECASQGVTRANWPSSCHGVAIPRLASLFGGWKLDSGLPTWPMATVTMAPRHAQAVGLKNAQGSLRARQISQGGVERGM